MGGLEPAGTYVLDLLRAGKPVVSANKQLVARRGAELFAAASEAGVQLRFEASGLRGDPRDQGAARVARRRRTSTACSGSSTGRRTSSSREMERGGRTRTRSPKRSGSATRRPIRPTTSPAPTPRRRWRSSRRSRSARASTLDDVAYDGHRQDRAEHVQAARELDMVVRLVGSATLVDGAVRRARAPALVDRHHPLASVEGAFNAVMLAGRRDPRDHARRSRRGRRSRRRPRSSPTWSA